MTIWVRNETTFIWLAVFVLANEFQQLIDYNNLLAVSLPLLVLKERIHRQFEPLLNPLSLVTG